jgi:DNA-binding transcriptional LysR family regulator
MDLKHLRTFVAVAELGTVSKAALRLRVAQPALSRQIIDLEKELGLTLFDRVGSRLRLTGEGEQLLGNCRRLLGDASSLADLAQVLRRGDTGVLKVTTSMSRIESIFPTFLHRYAEHYPNVQVRLIEGIGINVLAMVERGEAQLGIVLDEAVPAGNDHFGSSPLPPIEFLAACDTSLKIGHGRSIDIRGLIPYPLLLLDTSFVFRKTFDAACRVACLRPNVLFECSAPHTLLALAEAGHGVAIVPSDLRLHRYNLKTLRLTHQRKPIQEPVSIFWSKRRSQPRYAQDFCELLAEYVRKGIPIAQPSSGVWRLRTKRK